MVIVRRARVEYDFLKQNLPSYVEYTQRVGRSLFARIAVESIRGLGTVPWRRMGTIVSMALRIRSANVLSGGPFRR